MALRDYLVGEVTEDYADGLLTRRDAIKRLALLGLSVASASALLAACGGDDGDDAASAPASTSDTTATTSTTEAGTGDTTSDEVRIPGPAGELIAAVAMPDAAPNGALLVIHENGGLTTHFRTLVGELAGEGYVALCVDLVSREGGTARVASQSEVQGILGRAPLEELLADLRAGIDELERRAPGVAIGAVGFCFGGAMTWNLLDAGEPRLAAAIPFYGPAPDDADFSGSRAAVLGIYAELDDRVNASRDTAAAALERARLTHEIKTFAGAQHAFFNPSSSRHDPDAAREARADMLAWFDRHL